MGQFPDWIYEQTELQLQPGDRLLLFTDGLVEACDQSEEAFGETRLVRVARENHGSSASELQALMMRAASEHSDGHFQDDATVIVLRAL